MPSVPNESSRRRSQAASEWPSTPDIDGFTWELGPTESDVRWAAGNLNGDWQTDDATPDHILDFQAEEARASDLHERGLSY